MTARTAKTLPTAAKMRFKDIIAPVPEAKFFAEYYDRKPLYIPAGSAGGGDHRFDGIMNWGLLNNLLNMTSVWNEQSLLMVLDTRVLPAAAYCEERDTLGEETVTAPSAEKVMDLLRRGASLVANEIDSLTPELRALSDVLERAFTGRSQINLYCSWARHKAFKAHFDTHEVLALHIAGEKTWQVYENRMPHPIRHRRYENEAYTAQQHDDQKGAVMMEVTMRPGDVLYLPRGWYHDALADSPATIHLACGITGVIGFDLLGVLSDLTADIEAFRRNFPRHQASEKAFNTYVDELRDTLTGMIDSPDFRRDFRAYQHNFRTPRGGFDLPVSVDDAEYSLTDPGFDLQEHQGRYVLVGPGGRAAIPSDFVNAVRWIFANAPFSRAALANQFQTADVELVDKLIDRLVTMGMIAGSRQ